MKDDLSGLGKAIGAILGQRTIERNQLLVSITNNKINKLRDDKNDRATKKKLHLLKNVKSRVQFSEQKGWLSLYNIMSIRLFANSDGQPYNIENLRQIHQTVS
ncbi:hypothetical protein POM88_034824 [Heracleum sosnowskyi]|uniref:Uncharacterized protein n=1 Tax=Heracleum sosnowskyi TaxID=360622 RepID=A0AAD8MDC7_9APIA|nr:hypothetical protein POM88_034824 [Heracleum sosnowskyi]